MHLKGFFHNKSNFRLKFGFFSKQMTLKILIITINMIKFEKTPLLT